MSEDTDLLNLIVFVTTELLKGEKTVGTSYEFTETPLICKTFRISLPCFSVSVHAATSQEDA